MQLKTLLATALLLFGVIIGKVECQTLVTGWGGDSYNGQTPAPSNLSDCIAMAHGSTFAMALKADGTVVAWGSNWAGETVVPAGLSNVVAIAAGYRHALALKADGSVVAWGDNSNGQVTVPPGLTNVVAIAAGGKPAAYSIPSASHSLALKADGSVVAWGANDKGQSKVPASLAGEVVVAIAAGTEHSLALKASGKIVGWGDNVAYSNASLPAVNNITAICGGSGFSMGLKADGTVVPIGGNEAATSIFPAGLSDVTAIAAGANHVTVIKSDRSALSWGRYSPIYNPVYAYSTETNLLAVAAGGGFTVGLKSVGNGTPLITCPRRWITAAVGSIQGGTIPMTQAMAASGTPTAYTATGLPTGLTLNTATGIISGSPAQVGTFPITLSATTAGGTGSANVVLTVIGAPTIISLPTFKTVGASLQIVALGTNFTVVGLPSGLTLNPTTGLLSGEATPGIYALTLTVSNPYGSLSVPWNLEIASFAAWGANSQGQLTPPAGLGPIKAIATGLVHTLALKVDGTVRAWGNNGYGQATVPSGLNGVIAIAAGDYHSLALKSDGTLVTWGYDSFGQLLPPVSLNGVIAIDCGGYHSMALKNNGTIAVWGYVSQNRVPQTLSGVVAIAATTNSDNVLKADGSMVMWDYRGTSNTPVVNNIVNVPSGLMTLTAGSYNIQALRNDGAAYTLQSMSYTLDAVPVASVTNAVALAGGDQHWLSLHQNGTVQATGSSAEGANIVPSMLDNAVSVSAGGQQSFAIVGPQNAIPLLLPPPHWITEAVGARLGSVSFNQRIFASGQPSSYGAAGLPNGLSLNPTTGVITGAATQSGIFEITLSATNAYGTGTASVRLTVIGTPQIVALPPPVLWAGEPQQLYAVATGYAASNLPDGMFINSNSGQIVGRAAPGIYTANLTVTNPFGSLTVPWTFEVASLSYFGSTPSDIFAPLPAGISTVVAADCGTTHGLALKPNGTVVAWGNNDYGQTNVPTNLSNVAAVAAGENFSVALKTDGSVVAWGDPANGKTSVLAGLSGVKAIAVGSAYTLALRSNGTVVGWGLNSSGQLTIPALSGVVAIAAGTSHALALHSNGLVSGWGLSDYGQATSPGLTGVTSIAAGGSYSLAARTNGTVVGWGANYSGAASVPSGLGGVAALTAGGYYSLALKNDGLVTGWGSFSGSGDSSASNLPFNLINVVSITGGPYSALCLARYPLPAQQGIANQSFNFAARPLVPMAQFSAVGLPSSLSIAPTTGVISGTPATAGIYQVIITSTNPLQTKSESVTITINPPSIDYATWGAAFWPVGGSGSAANENPDGDGNTNLLEYALNLNPLTAGATPEQTAGWDAGNRLQLTIDVPANRSGLVTWTAQFSNDLSFTAVTTVGATTIAGAPPEYVRLQFTDPSGIPSNRRFGKLAVQLTP